MKQLMKAVTVTTALLVSGIANAQWVSTEANVSFQSTKNAQALELHQFTSSQATVSDKGELAVIIDLTSVDTGIEIRDTRMKEFLFETTKFGQAIVTAVIPADVLSMKAGSTQVVSLPFELSLHGQKVAKEVSVRVTRMAADQVVVASVKPVLVKADEFQLTAGVAKLQELAGLKSITAVVPVSFDLVLKQQ